MQDEFLSQVINAEDDMDDTNADWADEEELEEETDDATDDEEAPADEEE